MSILPPSEFFPPVDTLEPEGLVGFGGELTPSWLLDAYTHGIFPWPVTEFDFAMAWWSPDPRAVIELDRFHVPRRLARTCRSGRFTVTHDRDFGGVIRGCATGPGRKGGTWLTPEMIDAYIHFHELGHAHSIEVWHDGKLAGGTYGVAIGGLFAAESKFYRVRDASKVALIQLVDHLRRRGYLVLDIQHLTPRSRQFGAMEISRREYLSRLATALQAEVSFGETGR